MLPKRSPSQRRRPARPVSSWLSIEGGNISIANVARLPADRKNRVHTRKQRWQQVERNRPSARQGFHCTEPELAVARLEASGAGAAAIESAGAEPGTERAHRRR